MRVPDAIPFRFLPVVLCLTCCLCANSQGLFREEITILTDRHCYLAGEEILVSLHCRESCSGQPSPISTVAFLELLDSEGRAWSQKILGLEGGRAAARIAIPPHAVSREYTLRAYTSWMRNFGAQSFGYSPILILHPDIPYHSGPSSAPSRHTDPFTEPFPVSSPGDPAEIEGLQKVYQPRDTLAVVLKPPTLLRGEPEPSLTVSIVRSGTFLPGLISPVSDHSPEPDPLLSPLFLPDPEGLSLCGKVEERSTGSPAAEMEVLLSSAGNPSVLGHSKTGPDGSFRFTLGEIRGPQDMVVQIRDGDPDKVISLDPQFSQEPLPSCGIPRIFHEGLEPLYRQMLLHVQLTRAYQEEDLSGVYREGGPSGESPPRKLPFYGEYDHRVILKEFIELPVMEEVFRELGRRVFLDRDGEGYRVQLLDLYSNRIIGENPWFFLDGVPFFRSDQLLGLDPAELDRIHLKSEMYFYGNLIMDGVLDIRSTEGDARMLDLPRSAVRQYMEGLSEEWSPLKEPPEETHIPDYRTTVLFLPDLRIVRGSGIPIRTVLPDAPGSYDIIVRGFTAGGNLVFHRSSFSVIQ